MKTDKKCGNLWKKRRYPQPQKNEENKKKDGKIKKEEVVHSFINTVEKKKTVIPKRL